MALNIGARGRGNIGLDVSGRWMKAAQRGAAGPVLARVCRKKPGAAFDKADATALAGVLDRSGFQGRRAVLLAPRGALLSATLELPPRSSGAPIEQLARMEVARTHKCEPDSFELGLWDLPAPGREDGQTHVFAAALPVSQAEEIITAFEGTGLEIIAIDIPACALARGTSGGTAPDAIVDVGWDGAMLVVMHQGVVVYERMIEEGALSRLFEAAQTRTGMTADVVEPVLLRPTVAERADVLGTLLEPLRVVASEYQEGLAEEIGRSLAYVGHRYNAWSLRRLAVCGDGAAMQGLSEKLGTGLNAECVAGAGGDASSAAHLACIGASWFGPGKQMRSAA